MPLISPPSSIRATLLWWLLPLMVVFMAVAWLIHGLLLERMAREFVHDRLHEEASFLEQKIAQVYPEIDSSLTTGTYFEDVFHHAFAIKVGSRLIVSPTRWEPSLTPLLNEPDTRFLTVKSASGSAVSPDYFLAYRKVFMVAGETAIVVVAEDTTVLQKSQSELHLWTAFVALGLLVVLLALILLSVNLALRPVRRLRQSLADLQAGQQERLDVVAPVEFRALIDQLNQLLDTLDQRLERSRQAIANLSHSIKTPVAAVRQILTDYGYPITPSLRDSLANRLTDIDKQLEGEMRRARFAGPHAGKFSTPVPQSRELVWMLSRLYSDKRFDLNTELDEARRWPIEEHDFNEVIGNLTDNAGKWADRQVILTLSETQDQMVIAVTDDGSGVDDNEIAALGVRGMRLDQQTHGHGLGLSIVRDVAERYAGSLNFSHAPNGGLSVTVRFPIPHQKPVTR